MTRRPDFTESAPPAELKERTQIRERRESLTPREREVLTLVVSGKPNKVMAAGLAWSWTSTKATHSGRDSPLLARITRRSVTQLDIAADMRSCAQIKSVALVE